MSLDITHYLSLVQEAVKGKNVPVVDLIAIQTEDPFKVLVATILSARTKDETTAAAAARLFKHADTVEQLALLSTQTLEKLIFPVGFYKNKAGYLSKLSKAMEQFDGKVPETIEELLQLPGVGRKTANLVVNVAFKKPAICVDTHVHRIMNIWEYVETNTPLKTEMALRKKLPLPLWASVNTLLVSFGQSICRPISPHCTICPLESTCAQKGITPRKVKAITPSSTSGQEARAYRYISWNVNGIRAVEKKGFIDIVKELAPDVIGLQETKAQPDQLSEDLKNIEGYTSYWHSAERKGYSGVAFYTKHTPVQVLYGINDPEFDCEGRVITLEFGDHFLMNIYFPNSGDGLKRIDYKLRFNDALLRFTKQLEMTKPVLLCGDFNVAHKEIDLTNPKTNVKNAGFTPEERAWMDSFIEAGFLDTFRMFNEEGGNYSWWSYRFSARSKNIGWRIDYFCASQSVENRIINAGILSDIMGSDHCPVTLDFKVQ